MDQKIKDGAKPSRSKAQLDEELQAAKLRATTDSSPPVEAMETSAADRSSRLAVKAELLKKVRILRSDASRGLEVKGSDPNKSYTWVNVHPSRRVFFEGQGFTVCRDPKVVTSWRREDGTHIRGDLILYECDKEWKEALTAFDDLSAIEAMEGSQETFLAFAEQNKVPAQIPTD